METGTFTVKAGMAKMLKGGVIMGWPCLEPYLPWPDLLQTS